MLKATYEKINDSKTLKKVKSLNLFLLAVAVPSLIFFFYQALWASERFESRSKILVKQADNQSSVSPEMLLLGGLGVASVDNDSLLIESFIYSSDMLLFLDDKLKLKEHYSQNSVDFFSRIHSWDSEDDFAKYFMKHVSVMVEAESSIIVIKTQAFTSTFAKQLNQTIIERAEWFINQISNDLASKQLAFISTEHERWKDNLKQKHTNLLAYQREYNLLDPTSDGIALQSIAYNLEGQLASKKTELLAAQKTMSDKAPEVQLIQSQMDAISEQLSKERVRLTSDKTDQQAISEIIAKFSALKIEFELALQAYTGSLASMEKIRVEVYRQIKYLVTLEKSTEPDENEYPWVIYNTILFTLALSMFFGVVRIIYATIKELS